MFNFIESLQDLKHNSMYSFSFEKLEVWIKSRFLTKKVYLITHKFPESEKYGIVQQVRRAMISVCSNIAEGASRWSKKDQRHYYNMAFTSLMETLNQLILSNDLDYISTDELSKTRKEIHIISLMLNNLSKSLE